MILPALYHWSPREKRKGIQRRGLLPRCPTAGRHDDSFLAVCLSASPSCAWSLSGQITGEPGQLWDLWMVRLTDADEVHVLPGWGPVVQEIRVGNPIPKSRLWWVGERLIEKRGRRG